MKEQLYVKRYQLVHYSSERNYDAHIRKDFLVTSLKLVTKNGQDLFVTKDEAIAALEKMIRENPSVYDVEWEWETVYLPVGESTKKQHKGCVPRYRKTDPELIERFIKEEEKMFQRKLQKDYKRMWENVNFDEPFAKPFHDY